MAQQTNYLELFELQKSHLHPCAQREELRMNRFEEMYTKSPFLDHCHTGINLRFVLARPTRVGNMCITTFGLLCHSFWIESICRLTTKTLSQGLSGEANFGGDFGVQNLPHMAPRNFVRDFPTKIPKCNFVLAWQRTRESVWKAHPQIRNAISHAETEF